MRRLASLTLLSVLVASAALAAEPGKLVLPPPPFAPDQGLAQVDDTLRAINGEWQLGRIDGRTAPYPYTLTIWGSAFGAGSGCTRAQGQLRPLGGGRYRVERYGPIPEGCRKAQLPEPFGSSELKISGGRTELTLRSPDGRSFLFGWSDLERTQASDDFLRGEWLLASEKGDVLRGAELTRVSFNGRGYSVVAANCRYQTNGYSRDRNWIVRPGGAQMLQTAPCKPVTLGDRLAAAGDAVSLVAEPVEGRIRVAVNGRKAILIAAARHPELAEGVPSFPVDGWARQLAQAAAALPAEQRTDFLMRALLNGDASVGSGTKAMEIAFSGFSIADTDRLALADLPVGGVAKPPQERSLEELFLAAPIVAVAQLEAIEPVDRGDGLALDYRYRVVESWRGGQRTGDLLIVRMPPLIDKSRSRLITPEAGARVLLLASRPGYIAGTLRSGKPPSADKRVVAMTLPLLRVDGGKLTEAVKGANVLGSARFEGIKLEEARSRAIALESKVRAALVDPTRASRSRYFVSKIGPRVLDDPTRYWIEYDPALVRGNGRATGGIVAWYDGCLVRRAVRTAPGMNSCRVDRSASREPAIAEAVRWIDARNLPVTAGSDEPYAAITVPTPVPVTLQSAFR